MQRNNDLAERQVSTLALVTFDQDKSSTADTFASTAFIQGIEVSLMVWICKRTVASHHALGSSVGNNHNLSPSLDSGTCSAEAG